MVLCIFALQLRRYGGGENVSTCNCQYAPPEETSESMVVKNFVQEHCWMDEQLKHWKESGRTQKVWMFIKAQRTGDFHRHLYCVHRMLPIFHASGHFNFNYNYAKCAHVYLQDCLQISTLLCDKEYDMFVNRGSWILRRPTYWEVLVWNLWSNMTIEQMLMRSLKSIRGLTGVRGITPLTIANVT